MTTCMPKCIRHTRPYCLALQVSCTAMGPKRDLVGPPGKPGRARARGGAAAHQQRTQGGAAVQRGGGAPAGFAAAGPAAGSSGAPPTRAARTSRTTWWRSTRPTPPVGAHVRVRLRSTQRTVHACARPPVTERTRLGPPVAFQVAAHIGVLPHALMFFWAVTDGSSRNGESSAQHGISWSVTCTFYWSQQGAPRLKQTLKNIFLRSRWPRWKLDWRCVHPNYQ